MEGVYKVISFQKMSKSLLWLVWCCVLALPPGTDTIASESKSDLSHNEAIVRLSRVFGIDRVPIPRRHRSPPQYMVDLYHSVAYQDGITKNRSPYGSDVVRSLPDRDTKHQMHFYFNISYIKRFEKILEAEFHIFKLRPRPPSGITSIPRGVHIIELKLYQVLDEDRMYRADGVRLLDHRRISAHQYGWEVFKVRDTVQQWVNDNRQNLGFLVTATSSRGTPVNGTYVRFAQRSEHHDSKQPNLVVFTEDDKHAHKTLVTPSDADFITDPLDDEEESSEFREPVHGPITRQTYIQFLNEGVRAKHANNLRLFPNKQNFNSTLYRNTGYRRSKRSLRNTRPDRSSKRGRRSKGDTKDYYQFPRKRKQTCSKHELYVDFDEIGWSGWIISPKGYNAFHCKGECPFPLGQNQKPTNHATVQSIVHALRIGKDVGTPCCVPNKLYSISLLYFDDDENVILKQYDDMVAASCGCH